MPGLLVDSRGESRCLPIELLSSAPKKRALLSTALVGRVMPRRSIWDLPDNVSGWRRQSSLSPSNGKRPESRLELPSRRSITREELQATSTGLHFDKAGNHGNVIQRLYIDEQCGVA